MTTVISLQIFDVLFVPALLPIKFMFLTSDAGPLVGGLQLHSFEFIVRTGQCGLNACGICD